MKIQPISTSKAVIIFLSIAVTWILVTDYFFLQTSETNIRLYYYLQSFKGLAFIALTAAFIYFIIRRNNKTFQHDHDELAFKHNELETILAETHLGISRFDGEGQISSCQSLLLQHYRLYPGRNFR